MEGKHTYFYLHKILYGVFIRSAKLARRVCLFATQHAPLFDRSTGKCCERGNHRPTCDVWDYVISKTVSPTWLPHRQTNEKKRSFIFFICKLSHRVLVDFLYTLHPMSHVSSAVCSTKVWPTTQTDKTQPCVWHFIPGSSPSPDVR